MPNPGTSPVPEVKNDDLVITRVFNAPRKLVWKAWSDPEYLTRWWGPKEFTSPVCKTDLRVGGKYLYCMRSREGKDFWSTGTYNKVIPFERLVWSDSFADEKGNVVPASHFGMPGDDWPMELTVTVTFENLGDKTRMKLNHAGLPASLMKDLCGIGWNESFDKLNEIITQLK